MYRDISVEKVIELTKANVGTDGPRRITIEWNIDDEGAVVKPQDDAGVSSVDQLDDNVPTTTPKKEKTQVKPDKLAEPQQSCLDNSHDIVLLSEIGRIDKFEFTTTKFIPLESNLSYAETSDGRITIKYAGNKINTTWKGLTMLEQSVGDPIQTGVALLEGKDEGNRRTAVIKFIKKMRSENINQGDGVKLFNTIFNDQHTHGDNDESEDVVDPDADFRASGVGSAVYPPNTPLGQDFGKG